MTTAQKPDVLDAIRALCTGSIAWRVARDDGAYCMSFSRDDSHNPEQEANEWLATHLCDFPERFMGYKVQHVVVQSQLQEEALTLITRLSAAQASLLAKEAECEALRVRLEFLTTPSALRFVEEDTGMYRVYEDKAAPERETHFWQSMTTLYYPSAAEAIDAARAAADQGGAS